MQETVDEAARAVIEAARQPFLILDPDRRVLAANPSFLKAFHVDMEGILGRPLESICECSWDIPRLRTALEGLPGGEASFDDIEVDVEFPGVGRRTIKVNARIVSRDLGPGAHTILSIEDVTDRLRAERERNESEERFRRLFETAQDGILILDAESGRIERANPYILALVRRAAADLEGREPDEASLFEHGDSWRQALRRIQETGYARFEDLPMRVQGGGTVEVECVCNRYLVGERPQIQCNVRDVGDRKRAERALHAAQERLRQAQKMEAVGTLAGGVAHEYNNLLTAVNGYAALSLAQADPGGPLHANLSEILAAGERAAALTRQLLAYSRQQVLSPRLVDPNDLAQRVRELAEGLMGEKVGIDLELDPGIGRIRADPEQVEQALLNLVVKARDAMPEGGRIRLRTSRAELSDTLEAEQVSIRSGDYVVLTVTDTGYGMDAEARRRVFDPFSSMDLLKGGGLALSMTQGVIGQSGGEVLAESEPGQGSTFKVFLPAEEPPSPA